MGGGNLNACNIGIPRGGAARKRGRRLFGNARGRFRTRGRNSSATVRGTKWSMLDTCAGTLTTVQRGSVLVRDFRLKKNKVVKAGHKYLARSFRIKKKKK
jgi:ferric-dicitrate binding protein FerR (iron transport regulator)